jgi:branched-subunit amino acid permease
MKYRIIGAILAFPMLPAVAWLSGYNFDQRGETASTLFLFTFVFTALGGVMGAMYEADAKASADKG